MGIGALRQKLAVYLPDNSLNAINKAYLYSKNAHSGQFRHSGKPFIVHPIAVADILADWRFDAASIIAALLHDVVEDTPITTEQIKEEFGGDIASLVDGLSKISRLQDVDNNIRDAENFRKLLLAAATDWRVLLIKLADRLHNMRTLHAVPSPEKRRAAADQTLEIYAPIAARLGVRNIHDELQTLAFRHKHPYRFRILTKALNKSNTNYRQAIKDVEQLLIDSMDKNDIPFTLEKREKNIFSIYKKMEHEHLSFARVEDILGIRLIVNNRQDCYRALGVVHEIFFPLVNRFKDFIAIPKSNGYQSLHTRIVTRNGIRMDVQIRSAAMHEVANHGIAAHWQYKEGGGTLDKVQTEALRRLSSLMRLHNENSESDDFMEHIKIELFPSEMFVLTPKGSIISLPIGATALDMAYAIHTEVGDHAERAVINGHYLPLSIELHTGDQVKIITNPEVSPLPHWLHYVKTARARSRIRHILKTTARQETVSIGKSLLSLAFRKLNATTKPEDIKKEHWRTFLSANNLKDPDNLYHALGSGEILSDIAARALLKKQTRQHTTGNVQPLLIAGTGKSAIELSSCCHPLPFEPIVGLFRREKGLIIHAGNCVAVKYANRRSEKWTDVRWRDDANQRLHKTTCRLKCHNRPGLVTTVTAAISNRNVNIVTFNLDGGASEQDSIAFDMVVEVHSRDEFESLMVALEQLTDVIAVDYRRQ